MKSKRRRDLRPVLRRLEVLPREAREKFFDLPLGPVEKRVREILESIEAIPLTEKTHERQETARGLAQAYLDDLRFLANLKRLCVADAKGKLVVVNDPKSPTLQSSFALVLEGGDDSDIA
ncbi:MAG TPA: hypothetical protein VGM54_13415 [Chthoniobacter sp.]